MSSPFLPPEVRARAAAHHGEQIAVIEAGGRLWCVAVPATGFRALWQRYKAQQESPDPTTKADADVQLARAMLVPPDAPASPAARAAEQAAFDAIGETAPAVLDMLGEAAKNLGYGPFSVRVAPLPDSSGAGDATPTSPPTV